MNVTVRLRTFLNVRDPEIPFTTEAYTYRSDVYMERILRTCLLRNGAIQQDALNK